MKPETTYPMQGANTMQPRGITNNNPLNIEYGDNWQGLTGSDGRFAKFESAFYGIRAAGRILKNYRDKYGLKTVSGIVNRWAPPSDNNPTQKYIDFVASKAGVNANSPLSMADYPRVVAAMIHFENGFNPYEQNEIVTAVNAGFA
ncbi:virion protein [Shewanella baltica]|uniref:virion protein n=1 Tax=Shewanella baltica TaxID=62322 RepID=UPI003D7A38DE